MWKLVTSNLYIKIIYHCC